MKKTILLLSLIALPALAGVDEDKAYCESFSGTPVVHNDVVYCKSKMTMNWWSANGWCQSMGKDLLDITQMCDMDYTSSVCQGLKWGSSYNYYVWTKNVSNSSNAYFVNLSSGRPTGSHGRNSNTSGVALCR